ncbi:uncharacterized protein LOC110463908 isoform X3 [Mizuhopecten yessoensis]|uniref:uncharacterized protein LOC110463908 isoform X3 n=1 Tax=Mizuhopecten yessoensis TaxID=6573 RepID=UPI000B4585BD|nr:uncharacterized protein LOC110463908 isoform X3 [Mizuhopecten yessoensis]
MEYIQVDLLWYNGATNKCPMMENKTICTWDAQTYALDTSQWYFKLTVINTAHNNVSEQGEWILKTVKNNVKPNAVESFNVDFTNESTCLNLTWVFDSSIANSREKHYRVQYSPVADLSHNKTVWSDDNHVTVCYLTPYTLYKFTIAVHPDRNAMKGYWSDPVTKEIRTDQDVPNRSPEMVGYTLSSDINSQEGPDATRSYTVFWKSVPKIDRNGVITKYRIAFTDTGDHHTGSIIKNGTRIFVNIKLQRNKLYNVSIAAATVKGYSHHNSSLIIDTTGMTPADVMVERNASLYNVSWTVPGPVDLLTSYRVVYCAMIGSQQECAGELQKLNVPDSRTRHQTLPLTSNKTYLFGVSIVGAGVASAAKFESCIYVSTERPSQPQFSVDDSIGENSLRVEWDPIPCNNKQPYVTSFTITWCQTNNKLEEQCVGQNHSVVIPSTSERVFIIQNLEKGVRYGVIMLSSSSSQTSPPTEMKYGTPTNNDFSTAAIAGIVIGAVLGGVCVIAGILCFCRTTKYKISKMSKPYSIDIPQLEKYTSMNGDEPSVVADSSPTNSTGSPRSTNNSRQALLPAQHSMDIDCHKDSGKNNSGKSNGDATKRQNSRDSGKGGSLSTEPDTPDRLDPVPEDDTSPYSEIPERVGHGYTSKIQDTSGIESYNPSSSNNPYSVVHTSKPDSQTSVEEDVEEDVSQSSVERDREERTVRDSFSEVHINPTEITVMFVGATHPRRESAGSNDGYTDHNQITCEHDSGVVQPGTACTLSTENAALSQQSSTPQGNSSGTLNNTLMEATSPRPVGPVEPDHHPSVESPEETSAGVVSTSESENPRTVDSDSSDGYKTHDTIGTVTSHNTNNTQQQQQDCLPCVSRTDNSTSTSDPGSYCTMQTSAT